PPKKKPSILIIDPDLHLANILLLRFQLDGWTARMAKSIEQAKKMLARKSSDILLLDPKHESESGAHFLALVGSSVEKAGKLIVHTTDFSRAANAVWKKHAVSAVLQKGQYSLVDFVKKIKKIHLGH
ncbi:MAG: hypothetical protein AAB664_03715, partial [Patescibacteria group bacterium]